MKNFSFFLLYFLCLNHIYIICDESSSTCFEYSCEKCSPEDNKYCTKCRENFYLIDGKCPCADHRCALCDTGRYHYKCLLCKNGYYNFNNDCYSDIDNCAVVKNNECTLCYDGYIYNEEEKKCERETEDNKRKCFDKFCDICLSEEKGTCEECKKGYILIYLIFNIIITKI